jgi:hypothetical protein
MVHQYISNSNSLLQGMAADTTITRAAGTVDVGVGVVVAEDISKEEDIKHPHLSMEYPNNMEQISMACSNPNFYANKTHQPNNKKYFKNWNYCWSHGYDVADDHHSGNCSAPAPGHVHWATRDNPCGGCQKAKHKTEM